MKTEIFNFLEQFSKDLLVRSTQLSTEKFYVEYKEDNSPVTTMDKALSTIITTAIRSAFPDHLIISEEEPLTSNTAATPEYVWYIDPLDGTKEFIKKSGQWAIHIGCTRNGTAWAGSVIHPEKNKIYLAVKGRGAFQIDHLGRSTTLSLSTKSELSDPKNIHLAISNSHRDSLTDQFISKFNIQNITNHGSVGLKAALIATGQADLYFNSSGHCSFWDTCAPEIIVREAGGEVCLANGQAIPYNPNSSLKVKDIFLIGHRKAIEVGKTFFTNSK